MRSLKIFLAIVMLLPTSFSQAATFFGGAGKISASVEVKTGVATVCWEGIGNIAFLEQYRVDNSDGQGWVLAYKPSGNCVSFEAWKGDRFQLVNTAGQWLFLSPELAVQRYKPFALEGVDIECESQPSRHKGCALQLK